MKLAKLLTSLREHYLRHGEHDEAHVVGQLIAVSHRHPGAIVAMEGEQLINGEDAGIQAEAPLAEDSWKRNF